MKLPHNLLCVATLFCVPYLPSLTGQVPREPIEIGTRPQLFVDDYVVDNHFAMIDDKTAIADGKDMVIRKFHSAAIHGQRPVIIEPGMAPNRGNLRYDAEAKLYRMWYQSSIALKVGSGEKTGGEFVGWKHMRYAESKDGLNWIRPNLGQYAVKGDSNNNICLARPGQFDGGRGEGISSIFFLNEEEMPAADRRGYKYLATYTLRGGGKSEEDREQVYLVGSKDGIHWDRKNQVSIFGGRISDGWLGMLYDDERKSYVSYGRPRDRYQFWGGGRLPGKPKDSVTNKDFMPDSILYSGVVRRIGRSERAELWIREDASFQALFQPDELDRKNGAVAHMSMMAKRYAGIYFGFLIPYDPRQRLWSEVIFGRDGMNFQRTHEQLIPLGPKNLPGQKPWNVMQAWAFPSWIEKGDEWWFPFTASDRPPNVAFSPETLWGLCLGKIRKEGFVSLRTPGLGGAIVTRLVKWPGGDLIVNCDAAQGEMRVRVSDSERRVYDGFNYSVCAPFSGSSVAHKVKWKAHSLDELKGREIRLEFFFSKQADLYSFRATGDRGKPSRSE